MSNNTQRIAYWVKVIIKPCLISFYKDSKKKSYLNDNVKVSY